MNCYYWEVNNKENFDLKKNKIRSIEWILFYLGIAFEIIYRNIRK